MVTGASGLLGANLVLEAMPAHEVIALSFRHPIAAPGVLHRAVDLTDPEAVRAVVDETQPAWIVHCAAATGVDACERDPHSAFRLNRDASQSLAHAAAACGASFLLVSTDAVFDGQRGDYDESAAPNPLSVYGRSKREGELAVLAAHPRAVVVRTNLYGWNALPKYSLAEWFLSRAEAGLDSPGWTDVTSTPILVNDLARILLGLLAAGSRGIFHVGGATCLSKYEFGRRVLATFGHDPSRIVPASVDRAGLAAPRAHRLCLRGEKVEGELGVRLPSVDDGLSRFRGMRDSGVVDRLRALPTASGSVLEEDHKR